MSQRRTRFSVTLSTGERRVILHYSARDAASYYARRGYTVVSVTRGDYRAEARKNERAQGGGFRPDWRAIREAIEFLGVKMPVEIKFTGHRGGRYGAHSFRARRGKLMKNPALDTASGGMVHAITVKNWLTPEQAGRTLWHELCHAMQSEQVVAAAGAVTERECFMAWSRCSERGRGVTYSRKPIEVEAREYEKFNDEKPLAR